MAAALLAGVLGLVLLPVLSLTAPAGAASHEFELDMVEGVLELRGGEPYEMENPTSLDGTNTDGNLSGIVFETPVVSLEQDITQPAPAHVNIDATFSQLAPGTGQLNPAGDLTVQLALAVDLHIVIDILPDPRDCKATPINLTLTSTAPYVEDEDGLVTLAAPNFSIPAVPVSGDPFCDGLVADAVNTQLQGSGHSLSMTFEGFLDVPDLGEPTATSLEVTPDDPTRVGDEVTLEATVVADPVVPGAPALTGQVVFSDGTDQIGIVPLEGDGTATLATSDLLAGNRQLSAKYLGASPDWKPSTSSVVPYTVTADPAVSTDLSGFVVGGGDPHPFGVTVTNTGFGAQMDDAELRVTISRVSGFGPLGPDGGTPRLVLREDVDGTPSDVTLTPSGSTLTGVIGDADTWDLAPGEELTESLDLAASTALGAGPLLVTFTLVSDPGGTPVTLGTTNGQVLVSQGDRVATTINAGDPGFPPFFPTVPPVTPIVARQGGTLELYNLSVTPDINGVTPTGIIQFAVDGRPVSVRRHDSTVYQPSLPLGATNNYILALPADIATGTRQVEVRYNGDALFLPSQVTWPVDVLPATGPLYECKSQGVFQVAFTASVEVDATIPTVWATGRDLDLTQVGIELKASRTYHDQDVLIDVVNPSFDPVLEADIGPEGTVTFNEVAQEANTPMFEDDGLGPDRIYSLSAGSGAVPFEAAPGTSTPITLDGFRATVVNGAGFFAGIECLPVGTPALLGTVTAAGTTLVTDPGEAAGQGHPVTLTATALPASAGVIEFLDGTETIAVVPVDAQGEASTTTTTLPVGDRSLTARFFGGPVATSPSEPVVFHVGECGPFSDPGNGAVVRLVYLELLNRCPDADGYEFWTDRLDQGLSTRQQFANQISNSQEARKQIVIDAYEMMLERTPSAGDREFWATWLGKKGRYDVLIAELAASREFFTLAGGTDEGFIERLYERILDRSPSAGDLEFWVNQVEARNKRTVARVLFNQDEPLGVIVAAAYGDLLDRVPTAEERTAGIALMKAASNRSALYASIIKLDEFAERAQGFPNRD